MTDEKRCTNADCIHELRIDGKEIRHVTREGVRRAFREALAERKERALDSDLGQRGLLPPSQRDLLLKIRGEAKASLEVLREVREQAERMKEGGE